MANHMTVACPDCGMLAQMPALPSGSRAECPICARHLELTAGRSITAALGCALGTLLFLFPANLAPFASVSVLGMHRTTWLGSGIIELWNEHWVILTVLVGLFTIVLPFVCFGLLSLVLGMLRLGHRPRWLGRAFRWAVTLDIWAMPDVLLVAAFVAYKRVTVNLGVTIELGGFCFLAAGIFAMLTRASIDRRTIWRAIMEDRPVTDGEPVLSCTTCDLLMPIEADGQPCQRCGARLVIRKRDAVLRAAALDIAALIFYWPANSYPMSTSMQMGTPVNYRIIDGIEKLFKVGLPSLGVLIFFTSIAIPMLKILGLGLCVISVRRRSRKHLVFKTRLYRAVDELGRWSAVDPFIIALLVPLMNFGSIGSTQAAPGATAFILVVVLTLIASHLFDPRLMWDVAQD